MKRGEGYLRPLCLYKRFSRGRPKREWSEVQESCVLKYDLEVVKNKVSNVPGSRFSESKVRSSSSIVVLPTYNYLMTHDR